MSEFIGAFPRIFDKPQGKSKERHKFSLHVPDDPSPARTMTFLWDILNLDFTRREDLHATCACLGTTALGVAIVVVKAMSVK